MTVIFSGRADGAATPASYEWQEAARVDSITVAPCPDGLGEMFRFSSKESDDFVHGDWRAELSLSSLLAAPGLENWFAFEAYLPSTGIPDYMPSAIIFQIHSVDSGLEAYGRQPPLALDIIRRHFLLCSARYDANATSTQSPDSVTTVELTRYPLATILDRRVSIVIHVRWDYGSTGILQMWLDDYPVVDRIGPVGFNDAQGPYPKFGIAHCLHGNVNGSDHEIVVFNSGLTIGDADSSYLEMTGRYPQPWTCARMGT